MARSAGKVTGLAAGASSGNVMAGSANELIKGPSLVKFYACSSATGIAAEAKSGNDTLLEDGGTSNIPQANRFPIDPDDIVAKDVATLMDRLILKFRNLSGGAIDVYWAVEVTPLGRRRQ